MAQEGVATGDRDQGAALDESDGTAGSLTAVQERQLFVGYAATHVSTAWTSACGAPVVCVVARFGCASRCRVGACWRARLTPQKPLQRAYQRDPEAIERWRRDLLSHARQAKAQGAEMLFWDESGFRADTVHGKTWGAQVNPRA